MGLDSKAACYSIAGGDVEFIQIESSLNLTDWPVSAGQFSAI